MQVNAITKRKLHLKNAEPYKTCKKSKSERNQLKKIIGVMFSLLMIVILMPVILLSELDTMLDNMCVSSKKEVFG